jgi:hypothetical protein
MPIPEDSKIQKLKEQIETWKNRAAMARQQGNGDLEKQALDRKKFYESALQYEKKVTSMDVHLSFVQKLAISWKSQSVLAKVGYSLVFFPIFLIGFVVLWVTFWTTLVWIQVYGPRL